MNKEEKLILERSLKGISNLIDMEVWLTGLTNDENSITAHARVKIGECILKESRRIPYMKLLKKEDILAIHEELAEGLARSAQNLFKIEAYQKLEKILSELNSEKE
jgi:hypothetical protein